MRKCFIGVTIRLWQPLCGMMMVLVGCTILVYLEAFVYWCLCCTCIKSDDDDGGFCLLRSTWFHTNEVKSDPFLLKERLSRCVSTITVV